MGGLFASAFHLFFAIHPQDYHAKKKKKIWYEVQSIKLERQDNITLRPERGTSRSLVEVAARDSVPLEVAGLPLRSATPKKVKLSNIAFVIATKQVRTDMSLLKRSDIVGTVATH